MRPEQEVMRLVKALRWSHSKLIKQGNVNLAMEIGAIAGYVLWTTGASNSVTPLLEASIDLLIREYEQQTAANN